MACRKNWILVVILLLFRISLVVADGGRSLWIFLIKKDQRENDARYDEFLAAVKEVDAESPWNWASGAGGGRAGNFFVVGNITESDRDNVRKEFSDLISVDGNYDDLREALYTAYASNDGDSGGDSKDGELLIDEDRNQRAERLMLITPPQTAASNGENIDLEPKQYYYHKAAGKGATVIFIDTGINIRHPEFKDLKKGKENERDQLSVVFASPGQPPENKQHRDMDGSLRFSHGTAVAGLVFGQKTGIAKQAKGVMITALDRDGQSSEALYLSALHNLYELLTGDFKDEPVVIINLSLSAGYMMRQDPVSKELHNMLKEVWEKVEGLDNIVVTAASGVTEAGEDHPFSFPAREAITGKSKSIIVVGGVDREAEVIYQDHKNMKVYAPAYRVKIASNIGYQLSAGTSFASALTAGVLANHFAKNPKITAAELKQWVEENAYPRRENGPPVVWTGDKMEKRDVVMDDNFDPALCRRDPKNGGGSPQCRPRAQSSSDQNSPSGSQDTAPSQGSSGRNSPSSPQRSPTPRNDNGDELPPYSPLDPNGSFPDYPSDDTGSYPPTRSGFGDNTGDRSPQPNNNDGMDVGAPSYNNDYYDARNSPILETYPNSVYTEWIQAVVPVSPSTVNVYIRTRWPGGEPGQRPFSGPLDGEPDPMNSGIPEADPMATGDPYNAKFPDNGGDSYGDPFGDPPVGESGFYTPARTVRGPTSKYTPPQRTGDFGPEITNADAALFSRKLGIVNEGSKATAGPKPGIQPELPPKIEAQSRKTEESHHSVGTANADDSTKIEGPPMPEITPAPNPKVSTGRYQPPQAGSASTLVSEVRKHSTPDNRLQPRSATTRSRSSGSFMDRIHGFGRRKRAAVVFNQGEKPQFHDNNVTPSSVSTPIIGNNVVSPSLISTPIIGDNVVSPSLAATSTRSIHTTPVKITSTTTSIKTSSTATPSSVQSTSSSIAHRAIISLITSQEWSSTREPTTSLIVQGPSTTSSLEQSPSPSATQPPPAPPADPAAPPDSFECRNIDLHATSYVDRVSTANFVVYFCNDLTTVDAELKTFTMTNLEMSQEWKNPEDPSIKQSVNQVRLTVSWPRADIKPDANTCIFNLRDRLLDLCDIPNERNPLNFKAGGQAVAGEVTYDVMPLQPRLPVALSKKFKCRYVQGKYPGEYTYNVWGYGWGAPSELDVVQNWLIDTKGCGGRDRENNNGFKRHPANVKYVMDGTYEFLVRFGIQQADTCANSVAEIPDIGPNDGCLPPQGDEPTNLVVSDDQPQ
ncbi:hypothetical protein ABW21_db0207221 [Orbilia brochopaga]|nr:hypothetical protein ABW21_db0207221 [Drechslerella brochopaga]